MSVLIKGMEMPKNCAVCRLEKDLFGRAVCFGYEDGRALHKDDLPPVGSEERKPSWCPLVPVPPHGRLIDADALVADLKRQCKEVFKTDAVSPDDFWITRNQAYNERLWTTWCESLFDYLKAVPTIVPAEEGE